MTSTGNAFQKGFGTITPDAMDAVTPGTWNLLREDLSLPVAVLVQPRVEHNQRWMTEFATRYGVHLAPHGKTTMAAKLFGRQMAAGAWGITLATAHQCAIAHAHGVQRMLLANQLVGRANFEIVSTILAEGSVLYTLVDSPELVDQLGAFFRAKGQQLRVLLELGVPGGRAGARTDSQADAVIAALAQWNGTLLCCGVEVYEGVLKDEAGVRDFLTRAVVTVQRFRQQGAFADDERVILSGAGSAWYDVVADVFSQVKHDVDVVLRPGCYLTSDAGIYRTAQQEITKRNTTAHAVDQIVGGSLQPALELWAYVQSIPEPGLAIVGLGKRDAAFDSGLPQPVWHYRPGKRTPDPILSGFATTKLMDQHAYVAIPADADLRVGDMLGFEISHPCLTFDKWRYIAMVDEAYDVLEIMPTYF